MIYIDFNRNQSRHPIQLDNAFLLHPNYRNWFCTRKTFRKNLFFVHFNRSLCEHASGEWSLWSKCRMNLFSLKKLWNRFHLKKRNPSAFSIKVYSTSKQCFVSGSARIRLDQYSFFLIRENMGIRIWKYQTEAKMFLYP